jgi:hypothetical protein
LAICELLGVLRRRSSRAEAPVQAREGPADTDLAALDDRIAIGRHVLAALPGIAGGHGLLL